MVGVMRLPSLGVSLIAFDIGGIFVRLLEDESRT